MGSPLRWHAGGGKNMKEECCLCCMLMMMNQSSHGGGVVVEGSREALLVFQTRIAHAVGGGSDDAVVGKCASFLLPNGG